MAEGFADRAAAEAALDARDARDQRRAGGRALPEALDEEDDGEKEEEEEQGHRLCS